MHLRIFIAIVIYSIRSFTAKGWLQYPVGTYVQVSFGLSMPIELQKGMRMFFNWGFLVSYDLPPLSGSANSRLHWGDFSQQHKRTIDYDKYHPSNGSHYPDATAGEIYRALEDYMVRYGFHKTCLLKSICEVAKYPFDLDDENLLAEIVNYVLSPSLHNAFGENENDLKKAYESAEKLGASNLDCDFIYRDCDEAFIDLLTRVEFN